MGPAGSCGFCLLSRLHSLRLHLPQGLSSVLPVAHSPPPLLGPLPWEEQCLALSAFPPFSLRHTLQPFPCPSTPPPARNRLSVCCRVGSSQLAGATISITDKGFMSCLFLGIYMLIHAATGLPNGAPGIRRRWGRIFWGCKENKVASVLLQSPLRNQRLSPARLDIWLSGLKQNKTNKTDYLILL